MDKDETSVGVVHKGGLVVAALLAIGALVINKAPLETSRPALTEPHIERIEAAQDVEARLWQDPFGAVDKAREQMLKQDGGQKADQLHIKSRFAKELRKQIKLGDKGGAVVLAVMVSGGPYAEQVEGRRRTRYAVLAGLKARGFVPADSEHLGYFFLTDDKTDRHDSSPVVPFESFRMEHGRDGVPGRDHCSGCRLIVLWLDGSLFTDRPLHTLQALAQQFGKLAGTPESSNALKIRWRVVGPSTSDGLRELVDEAPKLDEEVKAGLKKFDFRFFSTAATAPDIELLDKCKISEGCTLSSYLEMHGVSLLRTIGTDDLLAGALIDELELRGLKVGQANARPGIVCPDAESGINTPQEQLPSSIAIISEGDTLYGRSLRNQFRYTAGKRGFCITRWHYFRGLDGRIPGEAASQVSDDPTKKDSKNDSLEAIGRSNSYNERPEGTSQYDYLRRLAISIREEDEALRKAHGREYGIRAIGVLGNDVYDKLVVLQALRKEMPHAIYFTTDLDARLFHPREQAHARNLIVASNFGLRLGKPLQRDIPPFRDSYQTSTYLGTLMLMADVDHAITHGGKKPALWRQSDISSWFEKPRLFEVSRSGTFDFSAPFSGPIGADNMRCSRRNISACRGIHPDPSPMVAELTFAARLLMFSVLTLALCAPALGLSRGARRQLRRFIAASRPSAHNRQLRIGWLLIGLLLIGLATLIIGLPLLLALIWPSIAEVITRDGKPLSLMDGISPWPTYAIYFATLVLCCYFVAQAWLSLLTNAERIAREFHLSSIRQRLMASLESDKQQHKLWSRLLSMFAVRFYRQRPGMPGARPTIMTSTVELFWKHYLAQSRFSARLLRTSTCVMLMLLLSELIASAIGDAPIAPQRGELTGAMQMLSSAIWPVFFFLVFFVVDATMLCVFFVRGLGMHHANWPERTLKAFTARTCLPSEYLNDWIDLQFIARRTRSVGALIYYPFIVLSLMLLARSSFFDNWYTAPSVTILATLSFAIVLGCAIALRRSVEVSRRQALGNLRDEVLRAKGANNSVLVSQLEALRERVEKLHEGAFAPYSEQPLLKALLMPFLTYGGTSLFDYLSLVNF